MAVPISSSDVERVLQPWLGMLFLTSNGFARGAAHILQEFAPYRQTLEELHDDLDRYVFTSLSRLTRGSMRVVMADYHTVRLTLQSINWLTDDLMGVLFDSLTPFSANYIKINDYALRVESLNALRELYQRYQSFMKPEELSFMVRMIKKLYPVSRYCDWLQ